MSFMINDDLVHQCYLQILVSSVKTALYHTFPRRGVSTEQCYPSTSCSLRFWLLPGQGPPAQTGQVQRRALKDTAAQSSSGQVTSVWCGAVQSLVQPSPPSAVQRRAAHPARNKSSERLLESEVVPSPSQIVALLSSTTHHGPAAAPLSFLLLLLRPLAPVFASFQSRQSSFRSCHERVSPPALYFQHEKSPTPSSKWLLFIDADLLPVAHTTPYPTQSTCSTPSSYPRLPYHRPLQHYHPLLVPILSPRLPDPTLASSPLRSSAQPLQHLAPPRLCLRYSPNGTSVPSPIIQSPYEQFTVSPVILRFLGHVRARRAQLQGAQQDVVGQVHT